MLETGSRFSRVLLSCAFLVNLGSLFLCCPSLFFSLFEAPWAPPQEAHPVEGSFILTLGQQWPGVCNRCVFGSFGKEASCSGSAGCQGWANSHVDPTGVGEARPKRADRADPFPVTPALHGASAKPYARPALNTAAVLLQTPSFELWVSRFFDVRSFRCQFSDLEPVPFSLVTIARAERFPPCR